MTGTPTATLNCNPLLTKALMSFGAFLDAIESPLEDEAGCRLRPVHYASAQNSSFLQEFG